jgi:hypothetical protein
MGKLGLSDCANTLVPNAEDAVLTPEPHDYYAAACADALVEDLTLAAVQAAYEVSETAEQFFCAVQTAIRLKELMK